MSHEFYQIMVGAPTISVHSWKQLALWSIEYSCLDEKEKKKAKAYFMRAWDEFCRYVVSEFDGLFESWVNEDGVEVWEINESKTRRRYGLCDVESEDHSIPTTRC
ncbi:hypothetical protein DM02DRAFT_677073 [Periconia macrospinosa]|uniref:Uncharacterized protein n=1 Tax=Periconia macrospinosa TaxID=97972 RepID=A0A2V1D4V6_9PLEO|nr:hypothetical protein DM02DRAFT_677073 [Periconia macrospinosa]